MILYALACDQAHEFESWFPSSDAYEAQKTRDLVSCPECGSAKVKKQILAHWVARKHNPSGSRAEPATTGPEGPDTPAQRQPVAMFSERERELRATVNPLREHV